MQKILEQYFTAWNAKDLEKLSLLFDEKVSLEDWDNSAFGIKNVLDLNKTIFETEPEIHANVINTICGQSVCFAQLKVKINFDNYIDVIDVFTFSGSKINSIRAYKG